MFKNPTLILFLMLFISAALRFFRLDFADGKPVFDERGYYVEAGRSYRENRDDPNPQHPPLGKELIAVGILLFGDNPYGWRMPSLVFSLVGIGLVYQLAKEMGEKDQRDQEGGSRHFIPLVSALLLSVDSMYFIYSRLAVLDMFLTAFVLLTMLFLWRTSQRKAESGKREVMNLVFLSVSFGLALATKWTAAHLVPVVVVFLWLRYRWSKRFLGVLGVLGVLGGAVYVATYAPWLTRHSFGEFVDLQRKMVTVWSNFDRDRVFTQETYFMRHAHSWIFNPVSAYFAEPTTGGKLRLVIGLYNPVILWGGVGWVVWSAWGFGGFRGRKNRLNHQAVFLLLPILSNYIPWFFIRRVQYPYYFLPSLPLLVILVASVLDRARHANQDRVAIFLLSAIIMFGYLFPFLTSVPANPRFLNPLSSGPVRVRFFYDETPERIIFSR